MMNENSKRDFDQAALDWDSFAPRVKLTSDIGDSLLKQVELSPDMDVLDFGCGTGLLSLRMAPRIKSLTGADSSTGMLDVMAGKAAEQGLSKVSTLHIDPESKDPFGGTFDLIVSSMVFHHIEFIGPVIEQLHAALKPGGQLCVADLDPDDGLFHSEEEGVFHEGFDRDTFAGALKQAGFSEVAMSDAASITKPVGDDMRDFSIFLAIGVR